MEQNTSASGRRHRKINHEGKIATDSIMLSISLKSSPVQIYRELQIEELPLRLVFA